MLVADDADIVHTDTGSISRPTLVSFSGRSRLMGEEAAPQISSESTLTMFNQLLGRVSSDVDASTAPHRRMKLSDNTSGQLASDIYYCGNQESFTITSLVGMFLAKQAKRVTDVYGPETKYAFAVPPTNNGDTSCARSIKEACHIAGIEADRVTFVDSTNSLVATYGRKLQALRGPEKEALAGKKTVLIEMGHTQTTIVVCQIGSNESDESFMPTKIGYAQDSSLGAVHFDFKLFESFSAVCKSKKGVDVAAGTKRGFRLLTGCERLRKLLSQLPEASITVENLTDDGDMNFSMKRDEFASISADLLAKFQELIRSALTSAGIECSPGDALPESTIAGIEILGGGSRMPIVQNILQKFFFQGIPLGAKFDDASVALGAALLTVRGDDAVLLATNIGTEKSSAGLSEDELKAAKQREVEMQANDAELEELLAARNDMESYILSMRQAPRRKHGEKINKQALEALLEDCENWMYDNEDVGLEAVKTENAKLREGVQKHCQAFFDAEEADRKAVEKQLEEEAKRAEAERAANGEEDEDHDTRKLKKADRMRMVMKNKEEGTELFKGGNFRPAAARYHKALTHSAKFFDLSPDDEVEVKGVKATLHLNLASCYLKLESWDQVIRNCEDALSFDPDNAAQTKAYFRRATAYEGKKDWDQVWIHHCPLYLDRMHTNVIITNPCIYGLHTNCRRLPTSRRVSALVMWRTRVLPRPPSASRERSTNKKTRRRKCGARRSHKA